MKKLVVVAAIAVLFVTNLFAIDKTIHSIGVSSPWDIKFPYEDYTDCFGGADFSYTRMSVANSGFSFIMDMGLGIQGTNYKWPIYNTIRYSNSGSYDYFYINNEANLKAFGPNTYFKIGWGGSPINNFDNTLSIHGFTGVNLKILHGNGIYYQHISGTEIEKGDISAYLINYSVDLGLDVVYAKQLDDTFGILASLDVFVPVGDITAIFIDSAEYINSFGDYSQSFSYDYSSVKFCKGISFRPKIAICWVF